MNSCLHNDIVGLSNRYLKTTSNAVRYDERIVGQLVSELANDFIKENGGTFTPLTLQEFLDTRYGYSKRRYINAVKQQRKDPKNLYKVNKIKAFVKNEKYSDRTKNPRMIMGRDPRFNIKYGRFTEPLEQVMMRLPCFAKGKDQFQRGDMMSKFLDMVAYDNDYSAFEATQRFEVLRDIELEFMFKVFDADYHDEIITLWAHKMHKMGTTNNGVHFDFWFCRGSGDCDTGLFNTILNYIACRYFEVVNHLPPKNFTVDGDDSQIYVVDDRALINTFPLFGFDAKLIKRGRDYHDWEFCNSKLVQYQPGKFVLLPYLPRLFSRVGHCINPDQERCMGQYFYNLGVMYSRMFGAMPLLKEFSEFLMRITRDKRFLRPDLIGTYNARFNLNQSHDEIQFCPELVKIDIEMSHDIGIHEQNRLINYFNTCVVDLPRDNDKRFNLKNNIKVQVSELDVDVVSEIPFLTDKDHIDCGYDGFKGVFYSNAFGKLCNCIFCEVGFAAYYDNDDQNSLAYPTKCLRRRFQ